MHLFYFFQRMYGNEDGSIPATFQIFYMIGWRPGPQMAKPAARGSQTVSIKDIEKMMEENKIPLDSGKK